MPRIALLNIIWGFLVLVIAAFMGVFNSFDLTDAFLKGSEVVPQWEQVVFSSSHGHTGFFGILHILVGLTMPYSTLNLRFKKAQTFGLFAGCIAMGPLMTLRAKWGPESSFSPLGMAIGACLSLAMMALIIHTIGLTDKLRRRE